MAQLNAGTSGGRLTLRGTTGERTAILAGSRDGNSSAGLWLQDGSGARTLRLRARQDLVTDSGGEYSAAVLTMWHPQYPEVETVSILAADGVSAEQGGEIRLRKPIRNDNGDVFTQTTIEIDAAQWSNTTQSIQGAVIKMWNVEEPTADPPTKRKTIELDAHRPWRGQNVGWITTDVLEIKGGSDLSEQFDVATAGSTVKPGMVVSIDPNALGKLVVATQPYDRAVAGIISGAGGVSPGMLMGQKGSVADGEHPVALTGRVYCHCDASSGPIRPGDLLTTSSTPGHAMKVTDHQAATGAILGKAMSSLDSGQGLVLVLVSLQ